MPRRYAGSIRRPASLARRACWRTHRWLRSDGSYQSGPGEEALARADEIKRYFVEPQRSKLFHAYEAAAVEAAALRQRDERTETDRRIRVRRRRSGFEVVVKIPRLVAIALVTIALVGCANLEPRFQQPRDARQQTDATIVLRSECGGIENRIRIANGVMISDRHVLTAAHAVRCAELPAVRVFLGEREFHRMVVIREDLDKDLALLEIAHAGNFGRNIVPPELADGDVEYACMVTKFPSLERRCDHFGDGRLSGPSPIGTSGSGVYDLHHKFVGIVTHTTNKRTIVARVTREWLRGVREQKQ